MSGWDDVQAGKSGSGAGFLTLKDGDAKKIHILDDQPHSFMSVYFNGVKRGATIDPDNSPVKGVKGFDARKRHAINVFDYDDKKIKVLAGSPTLFNQIKAVHKEWGSLEEVDLKISRSGSGMQDTKYSVVPTAKCLWNADLIEGQELFDLTQVFAITPDEVVQAYMEGIDPGAGAAAEPADGGELTVEEEGLPEDDVITPEEAEAEIEEAPARPPQRKPMLAKPAPKSAAPAAPLGRNELIMKINALIKGKERYKKPGTWKADVQKFGGKDKQSMSQLGVESLTRLYTFVKAIK